MKYRTAQALLLTMIVVPLVQAQVDRGRSIKTPTGDTAGVQRVSCVVQLDFDTNRGSRNFDVQTLNALLTSTALLDPAAKAGLNLSPAEWPKVAQVELLPAGQYAVRLGVTVTDDGKVAPTAAQSFLDALIASAKKAVDQAGNRNDKAATRRMAALQVDVDAAQKRYDAASAALAASPRNFQFNNFPDVDPRYIARNAAAERASVQLNLAGQRARLQVLDQELNDLSPPARRATTAPSIDNGPSVTQQTAYERFNAERISTRLNIAESEARLRLLAERVATTAPATSPTPPDYDRLNMDLNNARNALQQSQNLLEQARRESQNTSGTVRLIALDGKPNDDQ
ncbi:MAG: hypothetical protein JWM57_1947 [Phycisphaerales bacterium]|nr:hypothetical protein [Phycisphaerales bacterium]